MNDPNFDPFRMTPVPQPQPGTSIPPVPVPPPAPVAPPTPPTFPDTPPVLPPAPLPFNAPEAPPAPLLPPAPQPAVEPPLPTPAAPPISPVTPPTPPPPLPPVPVEKPLSEEERKALEQKAKQVIGELDQIGGGGNKKKSSGVGLKAVLAAMAIMVVGAGTFVGIKLLGTEQVADERSQALDNECSNPVACTGEQYCLTNTELYARCHEGTATGSICWKLVINCEDEDKVCRGSACETPYTPPATPAEGQPTTAPSHYCVGDYCNVGGHFSSSCYVNHWYCDERKTGGAGCNDNLIRSGVQSSSFERDCGTEQIDVTQGCPYDFYTNVNLSDFNSRTYDEDCTDEPPVEPTDTPTPSNTPTATPTPTIIPACNSVCDSNAQCPGDLVCDITGSGRCRLDLCLTESDCNCPPTATPTPVLACFEVSLSNMDPNYGDTITLTCDETAEGMTAVRSEFQVSINQGAYTDIANEGAMTAQYTINSIGNYRFRCRVCADETDTSCTAW